jgi:hypothetical protein
MNKLFTIVFPYEKDQWPIIFDYTRPVSTWKRVSLQETERQILAAILKGHIVIKGDTPKPLGEEIHIVERQEYHKTIEFRHKVR